MSGKGNHPEDVALRRWTHAGLDCATTSSGMGFLNGYVRVPKGHPAFGVSYERVSQVDAWGGLTYGSNDRGWFGFDTGHAGDHWTVEALIAGGVSSDEAADVRRRMPRFSGDNRLWTIAALVAETERVAEQFAAMTELPEPDAWQITDEELAELRSERDELRARLAEIEGRS